MLNHFFRKTSSRRNAVARQSEEITMPYILRIDSSARSTESHSRGVADDIEKALLNSRPDLTVRQRDLAVADIPHIANETIAGFYTSSENMTSELANATALSDELIEELKGAEALIISAPMYNFSMPSALKAWIDQIMRINATFSMDETGFHGLVPVKNAYLALAYGSAGYAPGESFSAMNYLEPYLVSLLGFLGIEKTEVFRIENTTGDADELAQSRTALSSRIAQQINGVPAQ